jgi:glutaminyl-peptide cyclotransferase
MARHSSSSWGWIGGLVLLVAVGVGLMLWLPASPAADVKPAAFDGDRAMKYLETVCKIGPRISGTEGMKKQQELIEKHFTDLGAKVRYQKFTAKQRGKKPVELANLIVSYNPDKARRVILCSHYDTRPIADQEGNPKRWTEPFVSANDGGSGVALLMELAHHMKDMKLAVGVDFVFFDGEEYIHDPREDEEFYFLGSRHFAAEAAKNRKTTQYLGAILLDMIAGKGAEFPIEQNSMLHASKLVKEVWDIADELKCDAFTRGFSKSPINDDHIALNEKSIPAIDIIDFEYPHWHKLSDVPKNCGPKQMTQVAKVCSVWIQRQK